MKGRNLEGGVSNGERSGRERRVRKKGDCFRGEKIKW